MATQPNDPIITEPQSGGNSRTLVILMGVFIVLLLAVVVGLGYFALTNMQPQQPIVVTATQVARDPFAVTSTPVNIILPTSASTATPSQAPTNTLSPSATIQSSATAISLVTTQRATVSASATPVNLVTATVSDETPSGEQLVAAAFAAPVGSNASAAVVSAELVWIPMTQIPVVTPTFVPAAAQAADGVCPADLDSNAVIDPTGGIFPAWDGHFVDTDFTDEVSPWPGSYVEYSGDEANPTADQAVERQILPGYMLVASGGATIVSGDVNLVAEEDASTFAIWNNTGETVTANVAPTNSNTFTVFTKPLAGVDSVRAALSYYAGQLLADNESLTRVAFYAVIVGEETLIVDGTYIRNCGTVSAVEAMQLSVEPTPVPVTAWSEPFVAPGAISPESRTLDSVRIQQAEARNFGCEQLSEDEIFDIQCSSAGELDGTYVLRPNTALATFSAQSVFRTEAGIEVFRPVGDQPDLTIFVNVFDQELTLPLDSAGYGYIVTATPVRGDWSPELIQSWANHLVGVSLNPNEVYRDPQTAEFGVSIPTAVPPCENPASGCVTAEFTVIVYAGPDQWIMAAHGTMSEIGRFIATPIRVGGL